MSPTQSQPDPSPARPLPGRARARRARRRLRRHRHEPALRAPRVLPRRVRRRAHAEARARRAVAGVLVARGGHLGQVPRLRAARRQPRRGRHPRADRARGAARRRARGSAWALALLGVFGAALLYGDGMITPAISVLSAVEGLEVAAPGLGRFVVPITVAILIGALRDPAPRHRARRRAVRAGHGGLVRDARGARRARHRRGAGRARARSRPGTPCASSRSNGGHGFVVLGVGVPGRDGRRGALRRHGALRPRARSGSPGSALVLPALLLNYFGQGALLLEDPAAAENPFFRLAPELGALPADRARHRRHGDRLAGADLGRLLAHAPGDPARLLPAPRRSATPRRARAGQIYVAPVNWVLMVAACALVLGFGSSSEPRGGLRHGGDARRW